MAHSFHVNSETGRSSSCSNSMKCSYHNNTKNTHTHYDSLTDSLIAAERIKWKTMDPLENFSENSIRFKIALCFLDNVATVYLGDEGLEVMENYSGALLEGILTGNIDEVRATVKLIIVTLKQVNNDSDSSAIPDVESALNYVSDLFTKLDSFKVSEVCNNGKTAGSIKKLFNTNDKLNNDSYRLFPYHSYWVLHGLLNGDEQKLEFEILSFKKGLNLHKVKQRGFNRKNRKK